jgi:hypothetical protein
MVSKRFPFSISMMLFVKKNHQKYARDINKDVLKSPNSAVSLFMAEIALFLGLFGIESSFFAPKHC